MGILNHLGVTASIASFDSLHALWESLSNKMMTPSPRYTLLDDVAARDLITGVGVNKTGRACNSFIRRPARVEKGRTRVIVGLFPVG